MHRGLLSSAGRGALSYPKTRSSKHLSNSKICPNNRGHLLSVDTSHKSNRITLDIPPGRWIIIPEVVVVCLCLLIEVLAWKAQVECECAQPARVAICRRAAKRI